MDTMARAFESVTFSVNPLADTFSQLAKDSVTAGVADSPTDLAGFLAPAPIDAVLKEVGKEPIDTAGLDKK
jgi:NitT/TauT family transport system substrate-binding protein